MNVIDKSLKTGLTRAFSMVLAAFMLTACGKSQKLMPETPQPSVLMPAKNEIVAKVGGEDIFYTDVLRIALERRLMPADAAATDGITPMDAAVFNQALDSVIDQKLLAQDATRRADDKTDKAVRRLANARERILSSIRVEAHIRETVTEEAMRKLFETQAGLADFGDEVRARIILVKTEKDALDIVKRLKDGGDFDAMAASLSLDADTRDRGGDLGYFTRDARARSFVDPIFAGKKGDITAPFKTAKGWHVAEILDRRRPDAASYEDSREALRNFLTFEAIDTLMVDLREGGDVTLIPVSGPDVLSDALSDTPPEK